VRVLTGVTVVMISSFQDNETGVALVCRAVSRLHWADGGRTSLRVSKLEREKPGRKTATMNGSRERYNKYNAAGRSSVPALSILRGVSHTICHRS
jgi:hypothetical protein